MPELKPWLPLIFRRKGRLTVGAGLLLGTLLSGIGLLALSGWFLTETALVGLLLAAGIQAYINLYVPGGGIRFFAVSRTVFRYLERVYNHNTVLQLLTDIRVALFDRLAARPRTERSSRSGAQWLSPAHSRCRCAGHALSQADCPRRPGSGGYLAAYRNGLVAV